MPPSPSSLRVSKRKAKRMLDKEVNRRAVQVDNQLRETVATVSGELGVPATQLLQRFAIVSPVGEQRKPNYWQGLIIEKSQEWQGEYDGPKKHYLTWVMKRLKEEKHLENLTAEDKERLAKCAEQKRAENKETKAAAMTRKKAVSNTVARIEAIVSELQCLNRQVGVEFALFATRGDVEDSMDPFFGSSSKASTFLQGHLNLPAKELLTLMDLWAVGSAVGVSDKLKNKKEALRGSVRTKLISSYQHALKSQGYDPTVVRGLSYQNYARTVYDYKIVLKGYPLTKEGRMVRPSDFPGGISGLKHAEEQLASGNWGFEGIANSPYREWKSQCDQAEASEELWPLPPYIPIPGSEYNNTKAPSSSSSKAPTKKAGKAKAKKGKTTIKSRETIEDDDDITEPELDDDSTEEESSGDSEAE